MGEALVKAVSVKSVFRALKILEAFSPDQPELTLNDLSKITGFYKSTILRQIDTLSKEGFLARDTVTGHYRLGAKLYLLGQTFVQSSSLLTSSDPIMKEVAENLQETTAIFIIDKSERLCLKMVSGPHFIRATYEPGRRMPIYAGASGKILLAFSAESFLNRIIQETGLKSFTELTITNPDDLRSELSKIKNRGWSISRGERVSSAVTISVPVFGVNGKIACALSTTGPTNRLAPKIKPETIRTLQHAGKKLSTEIGYLGRYWDKVLADPVVIETQ